MAKKKEKHKNRNKIMIKKFHEFSLNESSMFLKTQFNSHKTHNSNFDILEGHIDSDMYITYTLCVNGPKKGQEHMELYVGNDYIPTSSKKSYSRIYSADKIPAKYNSYWNALKSLYIEKYS